ncbi:MAG: 16S rRNA (guanine(527)-N(7))-methyltransferase RsmG [Clostridiales bacterium]|nr:16S rRNA (guanine(527)-N(7))-methyltransferase RsmG [Clostridiales bacterium]
MREKLVSGAPALGLRLGGEQLSLFETYARELEEYGKNVNLTAITGEDDIAVLHFLDSLSIAAAVPLAGRSMIDVGTGAGFPGLPLRIYESGLRLTLLDSAQKKVDFLDALCGKLGLEDVDCRCGRAEELSRQSGNRDSFDYAVSRAVAQLRVLCELCLPFVRPGGTFIAMKTPESAGRELGEASAAVGELGGKFERFFDYETDGIARTLVMITKIAPTPGKYPRRFSRIKNDPL